jgi:predicted nuclease with TOPRIM domain
MCYIPANLQRDNMREQLEQRLKQLKAEFEAGQKMLSDLEAKQANVRETMLRISGAIQVLEEELARSSGPASASEGSAMTEGGDNRTRTAATSKNP